MRTESNVKDNLLKIRQFDAKQLLYHLLHSLRHLVFQILQEGLDFQANPSNTRHIKHDDLRTSSAQTGLSILTSHYQRKIITHLESIYTRRSLLSSFSCDTL